MSLVYIALGSNLGDRLENLRSAIRRLESSYPIRALRASSVYENRAVGMGEADDFLNAVVEVETSLDPDSVLDACLAVELFLGRTRSKGGWAPRTIDLDVIHFESVKMNTDRLTLPHPRIAERDFVAVPLDDLISQRLVDGRSVNEIVSSLEIIDLKRTDLTLLDFHS